MFEEPGCESAHGTDEISRLQENRIETGNRCGDGQQAVFQDHHDRSDAQQQPGNGKDDVVVRDLDKIYGLRPQRYIRPPVPLLDHVTDVRRAPGMAPPLRVEVLERFPHRRSGHCIAVDRQEHGLQCEPAARAEQASQEDVPVIGDHHFVPVTDVVCELVAEGVGAEG